MKEEVIELEAIWYGGGYHFRLLNDKTGLILDNYTESKKPSQIEDSKIINFWKKVEELSEEALKISNEINCYIPSSSQDYWDQIDIRLYKNHRDKLKKYYSMDN